MSSSRPPCRLRARPAFNRPARRGVPQVHRHRRRCTVRSRKRVLHFRQAFAAARASTAASMKSTPSRVPGTPARITSKATRDIAPPSRVVISRCRQSTASRTSVRPCAMRSRKWAWWSNVHPPMKSPPAAQCEIGVGPGGLETKADQVQILKYAVQNVAHSYGKTATFMPKPLVGEQRQRHARPPVAAKGRQGAVRRRQVRRPLRTRPVLHRRHHQACQGDQCHYQRRHQQLQAPGARLRKRP